MKKINEAKEILKRAHNNTTNINNLKETLDKINGLLGPVDVKLKLVETWTELYNINYGYNPDAYLGLVVDEGEIVIGIFTFVEGEGYSFRERFDLDEFKDFTKKDRAEIITGFIYDLLPDFLNKIDKNSN